MEGTVTDSVDRNSNDLQAKIEKLRTPILTRFFLSLASDWALAIGGISLFLFFPNIFSFFFASILIGHAQHGMAVLGHEAVHRTISTNSFFNEFVGRVFCFFPVSLTVSSYRDFHIPHHKDPFSPNDPEMPLRRSLGSSFQPPFSLRRGFRLWFYSFFGGSLLPAVIFSLKMPLGKASERIQLVIFWTGVVTIAYLTNTQMLLALWFYSLVTTYISKLRIQGWYEHGIPGTKTNRYFLPNFLCRLLFPHNIWVHYEHHKFPFIPFYQLERVRNLITDAKIYSIDEMNRLLTRETYMQLQPNKNQEESTRSNMKAA